MKTRHWIFAIMALLLSSCLMKSLHPFYHKKDVYFDIALLGRWADQDSGQWTIDRFRFSKGLMKGDSADNSYTVTFTEPNSKACQFNAHLFRLNGSLYMDFIPIAGKNENDNLASLHMIPSHSLAKLSLLNDSTLKLNWYNEFWLEHLFKRGHLKLAHEVLKPTPGSNRPDSYILTASTDDLQKFIIKYGNDPDAFKSDWGGKQKDKDKEFLSFVLKRLK